MRLFDGLRSVSLETCSNFDKAFSAREFAAVVVTGTRAGHLHAGLFYGRNDELHSLDLGWEDLLRHDQDWDCE